ncbi:MAG: hypothetical protein PHV98_00585, partial [Candidatus Omnitrophica bacterium]|nr:hypothetical protein [Candidatus Omnitrophota bacterium]
MIIVGDYWIKLYIEILDDPKMATLPDRLWRRIIELFLLAGKLSKKTGEIPETQQLAWCLRMNTDELELDLKQIETIGIIKKNINGWVVNKFYDRQSPAPNNIRKAQQRERERKNQYYQDENVTKMSQNVTQINRLTDNRLTESEHINGNYNPYENPKILPIWTSITGMFDIPGREKEKVLSAFELLLKQYKNDSEFIDNGKKYFEAWKNRTAKDGRKYSKTNCSWFYDWMVAGEIPQTIDQSYLIDQG